MMCCFSEKRKKSSATVTPAPLAIPLPPNAVQDWSHNVATVQIRRAAPVVALLSTEISASATAAMPITPLVRPNLTVYADPADPKLPHFKIVALNTGDPNDVGQIRQINLAPIPPKVPPVGQRNKSFFR
jgi:hypothetical protein